MIPMQFPLEVEVQYFSKNWHQMMIIHFCISIDKITLLGVYNAKFISQGRI